MCSSPAYIRRCREHALVRSVREVKNGTCPATQTARAGACLRCRDPRSSPVARGVPSHRLTPVRARGCPCMTLAPACAPATTCAQKLGATCKPFRTTDPPQTPTTCSYHECAPPGRAGIASAHSSLPAHILSPAGPRTRAIVGNHLPAGYARVALPQCIPTAFALHVWPAGGVLGTHLGRIHAASYISSSPPCDFQHNKL